MKVRSSSVPTFYIKEGSGKLAGSKVNAANPYLAHIKKLKAPRRHPPPPPSIPAAPLTGSLPAIRPASNIVATMPQLHQQDTQTHQGKVPPVQRAHTSPPQHKGKTSMNTHILPHSQEGLSTRQDAVPSSPPPPTVVAYAEGDLRSSVNRVKEKLVRMQAQLDARREDITKNPSAATPQKWEMLEALEEEIRDMKLEVQISEQLQGVSSSLMTQSRKTHVAGAADDVNISSALTCGKMGSTGDLHQDEYEEEGKDSNELTVAAEATAPACINFLPANDMQVLMEMKGSLSHSRVNTIPSPYRQPGHEETTPPASNIVDGEISLQSRGAIPDIIVGESDSPSARPECNDEGEDQENDKHSANDEDKNFREDDSYDEEYGDDDYGDDDFEDM